MAFLVSSAPKVTLEISNRQSHIAIDHEVVRNFAARVLKGEGIEDASISIAFVDDPAIRTINRDFLQHDWPTDVITFRLSEPDDELLEAELVVSGELAATTARRSGASPRDELMLYVAHGLLHLCGYDDVCEDDARKMRRHEDEVLTREGWTNTFDKISDEAEDSKNPDPDGAVQVIQVQEPENMTTWNQVVRITESELRDFAIREFKPPTSLTSGPAMETSSWAD